MSPEKTRCRDDGTVHIGRDDADVDTIATAPDVAKASVRDLAIVVARGAHAATTVAATSHLAAQAGIAVFATGGLGGVHRDASSTFDESADLTTLSRTAITVVFAGVKSILAVGATLERPASLGDRKSAVSGTRDAGRVNLGGRRTRQ